MSRTTPRQSEPGSPHARTFVFLLLEDFAMMGFTSAIEALRSLNRLIDAPAYVWRLASLDGASVRASNGISIPTEPLAATLAGADVLLVCGGLRIRPPNERALHGALRGAARAGIALGSLSTAAYLLAKAGLLAGYRCTIHWENLPAFKEEFPDLDCTGMIYEIDRDRLTCSGGTAALDMMLHLIAEHQGEVFAQRVANQFHHERIRDKRDEQRGGRLAQVARLPPALQATIKLMQRHIEDPLAISELARHVKLSPRQLERLFLRHERVTPARYYVGLRIDRARELLLYSDRSIIDIAVASGFTSTSRLSYWFQRLQGMTPTQLRARPVLGAASSG